MMFFHYFTLMQVRRMRRWNHLSFFHSFQSNRSLSQSSFEGKAAHLFFSVHDDLFAHSFPSSSQSFNVLFNRLIFSDICATQVSGNAVENFFVGYENVKSLRRLIYSNGSLSDMLRGTPPVSFILISINIEIDVASLHRSLRRSKISLCVFYLINYKIHKCIRDYLRRPCEHFTRFPIRKTRDHAKWNVCAIIFTPLRATRR